MACVSRLSLHIVLAFPWERAHDDITTCAHKLAHICFLNWPHAIFWLPFSDEWLLLRCGSLMWLRPREWKQMLVQKNSKPCGGQTLCSKRPRFHSGDPYMNQARTYRQLERQSGREEKWDVILNYFLIHIQYGTGDVRMVCNYIVSCLNCTLMIGQLQKDLNFFMLRLLIGKKNH